LDPVSGINTIVQVWKAVDNGVQLDSRGVCAEDNTLVYNPDEHVRMPFHKFKEFSNVTMQDAYDQLASETLNQKFKRDQAEG
jgi:hypothetical protein